MNESEWLKCDNCGVPLQPVFVPEHHRRSTDQDFKRQVIDGMGLKFNGGYAMFRDEIMEYRIDEILLCHNCTANILDRLSLEIQEKFKNSHSYALDSLPCCNYGWEAGRSLLNFADGKPNE